MNITLKIKAYFINPNNAPSILLKNPKEAVSAIFVIVLPSKTKARSMIKNVPANATI